MFVVEYVNYLMSIGRQCMFEDHGFSHYVSYGPTDQQTLRETVGEYDGILVPGTVATFQRQGTGGFVLALSATAARVPYIIDPRFPLFQQILQAPKLSHKALARILGDPNLVAATGSREPSYFSREVVSHVAAAWVDFNRNYRSEQDEKFEKYAKRLKRSLVRSVATSPARILAPYFSVTSIADPWWSKSCELYDETKAHAGDDLPVTRVISAQSVQSLDDLLRSVDDDAVCVWVSGMNEFEVSPSDLATYGRAIQRSSSRGQSTFALYGGFFSILLASVGLSGASHGIGYGDHRVWRELPQSGPPPARYYLPTVHKYVSRDVAQRLWHHDPQLIGNAQDRMPIQFEYHDLMTHAVLMRSEEVRTFGQLSPSAALERLKAGLDEFRWRLAQNRPDELTSRMGRDACSHLQRWIDAMEQLA